MEITFHKARKIKIEAVKNPREAGASWVQINIYDRAGEHVINCFPENGMVIPISLHPMGDDDD